MTFRIAYEVRMNHLPGSRWERRAQVVDSDDVESAVARVRQGLPAGMHVRFHEISVRCSGSARGRIPGNGMRPCQRWTKTGRCRDHAD